MPKKQRRWHERGWRTQEEANEFFRSVVRYLIDNGFRPGMQIPQKYTEVLTWLIEGHPQVETKVGRGILYFTLHDNGKNKDTYGRYGFSVVDNSHIERSFSLLTALRGENNTKRSDNMRAFRHEVREQMLLVRREALGTPCPVTGEQLTEENCEVDHIVAFDMLLRNFLCGLDKRIEDFDSQINQDVPGRHRHTLVDRSLAAHWQAFHAYFAKLEAVSVEGHRRRTEERRNNIFYGLHT